MLFELCPVRREYLELLTATSAPTSGDRRGVAPIDRAAPHSNPTGASNQDSAPLLTASSLSFISPVDFLTPNRNSNSIPNSKPNFESRSDLFFVCLLLVRLPFLLCHFERSAISRDSALFIWLLVSAFLLSGQYFSCSTSRTRNKIKQNPNSLLDSCCLSARDF